LRHTVVAHERLSADPACEIPPLFEACGLVMSDATRAYLTRSSTSSAVSPSPTTTIRSSHTHSAQSIAGSTPKLVDAMHRILALVPGGTRPHLLQEYLDSALR
jgi:hypothetical protein